MKMTSKIWRVRSLKNDFTWEGKLVADWELNLSAMSDDYTPDEIGAVELFQIWVKDVKRHHPDLLIPIYWAVSCPDQGKYETMPFMYWPEKKSGMKDFLSYNSWPVDVETGERLNWLSLPVQDKKWNHRRGDKGGFIQEATGWKPGILQPVVYLPTLLSV